MIEVILIILVAIVAVPIVILWMFVVIFSYIYVMSLFKRKSKYIPKEPMMVLKGKDGKIVRIIHKSK